MNVDTMGHVLQLYLDKYHVTNAPITVSPIRKVRTGIMTIPSDVFDIDKFATELHFIGYTPCTAQDHLGQWSQYNDSRPPAIWLVAGKDPNQFKIGLTSNPKVEAEMLQLLETLIPVKTSTVNAIPVKTRPMDDIAHQLDTVLHFLVRIDELVALAFEPIQKQADRTEAKLDRIIAILSRPAP